MDTTDPRRHHTTTFTRLATTKCVQLTKKQKKKRMGYWRHNNNCSLNSIHSFARALALTLFLSLADSFLGVQETSPALSLSLCHCCTSLSALSLTPAGLVVIDVLSGFSTSDVNFFFSFVFCFCFAGFSRFALLLLLECIFLYFCLLEIEILTVSFVVVAVKWWVFLAASSAFFVLRQFSFVLFAISVDVVVGFMA